MPNTEVPEQIGIKSVKTMLLRAQACLITDYPKQIFYGELWDGKRTVGEQKKRYKDSLKATLKELHVDVNTWGKQVKDRLTLR